MFDIRPTSTIELDRAIAPAPADGLQPAKATPEGELPSVRPPEQTHQVIMDCLEDEGERQAEERYQMAIDEDYNDHQHWRPEDAQVLLNRGQAPLVYNQGRQTIEWISGTEKRMRMDFKVLPREPDDEQGAELKTHLLKYTDDANMTQWHRSKAFKEMAVAGLGWLEEGINEDPSQEIIYSGSESWRNILRDSRGRDIMLRDWRYCFRKKRLDLDYAQALLSRASGHRAHLLTAEAYTSRDEAQDIEGPWYLGQKLTSASDIGGTWQRATTFDERSAYMQSNGYYDSGRRLSVDVIEAWYRVPEAVQVFVGGMLDGQIFNDQDPRHRYAKVREGAILRDAVRMRMRVMICTEHHYLWDGPSPFTHGQFLLIPLVAYRRARDGLIYGVWRGMRDLSDDTNKRRAKALWALSSNRVKIGKSDITEDQDIDMIREEVARVDGVLVENQKGSIEIIQNTQDVTGNIAMAEQNLQAMRDMGGVTSENLGLNTSAQSGKAILAKQDQGSLTTSDLFDNYKLAIKMQGKIRVSHMEQFYTQKKAIRIAGKGTPFEWIKLNEFDPETGEYKNDITQRQADFEVDAQDFRSSLRTAALESMFALLGQIATFAPQIVASVLDLVVEAADLPNKQEWVTRIRGITGQRDPSKAPTPEELAADAQSKAKAEKAEKMMELLQEAEIALKAASAKDKDASATLKLVQGAEGRIAAMMQSLEGAIVVTNAPHLVAPADAITDAAGLNDLTAEPGTPASGTQPMQPPVDAPQQLPAPDAPVVDPALAAGAGMTPAAPGEATAAVSTPQ